MERRERGEEREEGEEREGEERGRGGEGGRGEGSMGYTGRNMHIPSHHH